MSAIKYYDNIDLAGNQLINVVLELLSADPGSPAAGRVWYRSDTKRLRLYDGTSVHSLAHLDDPLNSFASPTGDVSFASHKITNLADPTNPQDAATKNYVDVAINGFDWKANVKLATAAALPAYTGTSTQLTATANGALTVDGVTPAVNDRILVKNETSGQYNGIYYVQQVGDGTHPYILTRPADATTGTLSSGAAVVVEGGGGTANNNTAWVLTTADPITVGTTSLTWQNLPGAGSASGTSLGTGTAIYAGLSGTTLQFNSVASANAAITVSLASGTVTFTFVPGSVDKNTLGGSALTVANGGTGATTAAGARTNLGAVGKYAANIGDGTSTTITVTHSLGTTDVQATFMDSSGNMVMVAWQATSTSAIQVTFNTAPATNAIRVVVIG